MNRYQRNYALAKAAYEAARAEENRLDSEFCKAHNLKNPDGTTPDFLFCWDTEDESAWDTMNELQAQEGGQAALDFRRQKEAELKEAENALIEYALSIAPAGVRDTLRKGAETMPHIRKSLLDAVFRLDTRTIR